MPSFLHYNPIAIKNPQGLNITMVTLGVEVMRKRKKSGWDCGKSSKRPQERTSQGPIAEPGEAGSQRTGRSPVIGTILRTGCQEAVLI